MSHDNFTPSFGGKQGLDFWFGNIVNGNGQFPAIGFNGSGLDIVFDQITFPANAVDIHPGPTQMGIIAWHSPLTGSVSITGGVSDNDPDTYCYGFGDGIKWYLDKNSTNLADGIISPGGSQDFANGNGAVNLNTVVVDTTDVIYLAIHPNGNYGCDNTRVDLSISVTGTPTATPIVTPIPTTVTPEPPPTSTPAPNCGCGANEVDNGCSIAASNQGVFHTVSYIQQAVIDLQLLHRVEDEILSQTPEGQHYIDLYYGHGMEIVEIIRSSPAIREEAIDTIQLWEPNLQALVDGEGNTAIITSGQVQAVQTFLDDLSALGSSELQQTIASERENMPLEQTIGTTMDQAWEEINPPDVDAGVDISTVAGTSVQFNGVIQNINPNTIQWNFGDGSTASGTLTPLHTYVNSGLYTVTLTVTDSAGSTISDTLLATVTPTSYTLVLQPNGSSGIDTYILSSSAASNYGAIVDMGVGEDNGGTNKTARSLIKFDLSSLPANATITSATLSLWTSQDLSSNTRTVRVYRLKQAFSETQATWNKATSTTSWQTVGASGANDRESTEVGSVQILDNVLLNTEKQIVLTPAKIQEMRNGTFTNNGFIIVADTETNDRFAYKTSDNTSATQRPKLVIQYTVPSTPDSIFADGFESGDFSHWSDSDWESGNLTVSTQSAAVGSDGMQAVITDTGSMQAEGPVNVLDASDPFYFNPNSVNTPHGLENLLAGTSDMAVYDTTPNDEKHYDARFYFDPNSINLPNGQGMYLFAGPNAQWAFCLYLERQGIDYRLSLCGKDDSNNWLENKFVYINDGWQAIEIEWQAANAPGANNGYMKLFINNVLVDTMKNLDTDTRSITDVALGVSGVPVGTTGTVYFDAFDSRRSSHIGPDANGPALQSPLTNLVFQDGFESGDLSSWAQSQLITDGGDLSVSSSAAMFGSYGLQALIDDTNVIYTKDFSPAAETHYSARVYFDPHSVSITNGQSFYILGNDNLRIRLKNNNGTYQLRASIYTDSGAWIDGTSIDISNSRQLLEVEWKTSSSSIANDGYLKFWINDSLIDTIPSVDNDTRVIENINVGAGATYVIPSGTSGTIYFDNFESRNGGHIGP
jgi:PKD repeat protein